MKKLISLLAITVVLATSCTTSQRRTAYNTLYSVHTVTDSAFNGYIDLVIKGRIGTNDLPKISNDYTVFQVGFESALFVAHYNTNALADENLVKLSNIVLVDIKTAKGLLK